MGFYDEMAQVATEVLTEFKQGTIQLRRIPAPTQGANSYDRPTQGSPTNYELNATVSAGSLANDKASSGFVDGQTILATDKLVTSSVPPVEPRKTDFIVVNGIARSIKKIIKIPDSGVPVAYKFIIEG